MKRGHLFLALAGAFAMALPGSPSFALNICPLQGNYAIKIIGAQTDVPNSACTASGTPSACCTGNGTGTCGADPTPQPIAGVGVFTASGPPAGPCVVTGEFIYNDAGTITGPIPGPPATTIQAFTGAPANLSGSYSVNGDNTGLLTLTDSAAASSFGTVQFGIAVETGDQEFRGTRINPGDPLNILAEKQAAANLAQFEQPFSLSCDDIGLPASPLGLGYAPVTATSQVNVDPNGTGALEAGGNGFYNNNNGWISGSQILPPGGGAYICDHNYTFVGGSPFPADITQNTSSIFLSDFGCPLAAATTQESAVGWGTTTQGAFQIFTGANGAPFPGVGTCSAGRAVAGMNILIPSSAAMVRPGLMVRNLALTNGTGKPLNIPPPGSLAPGMSVVPCTAGNNCPGADVPLAPGEITITSTTLGAPGVGGCSAGDVPALNPFPVAGSNIPGTTNTCSITLTCTAMGPLLPVHTDAGYLVINADNRINTPVAGQPPQSYLVTCRQ